MPQVPTCGFREQVQRARIGERGSRGGVVVVQSQPDCVSARTPDETAGVVDGAFGRGASSNNFKPQLEVVARTDIIEARCDGVGRGRHGGGFPMRRWPGVGVAVRWGGGRVLLCAGQL